MDTKELFNGFDPSKYEAEAEERWGDDRRPTRKSSARDQGYTAEDWTRQQAEQARHLRGCAAAMRRAASRPTAPAALAIAERHRLSIDRWFYPCSRAMHAGLADMYEADERFRASIDAAGEGLTAFLAAAIRANAARGSEDPGPHVAQRQARGLSQPPAAAQSSSAAAAVPKVPLDFCIR